MMQQGLGIRCWRFSLKQDAEDIGDRGCGIRCQGFILGQDRGDKGFAGRGWDFIL